MSRIGIYQILTDNTDLDNPDRVTEKTIQDNNGAPIVLSYCIFRPRQLHDENKPPLLCLHGGPSIPSNYLLPIVNGVTDRAVIFYDQWGCGKSSRPQPQPQTKETDKTKKASSELVYSSFSIPTMVEHLRQLIEDHWNLKRFHLLGHSFGGILAYEYLLMTMTKRRQPEQQEAVCSLILSSTPTSAALIQLESERLYERLTGIGVSSNDSSTSEELQKKKERLRRSMMHSEDFRQTHECRLPNPPLALLDALAQMGPVPWRGVPAIDGYEALGSVHDRIPSLLLRGEYDFCTEACMRGWKERLCSEEDDDNNVEERILANCSHYAMLEDEDQYGKELLRFVKLHDKAE